MARKMGKKKLQYPAKATLNLVMRERSMNSLSTVLPVFLVLLFAVGAFAKFAVIDRLLEAGTARASLAAAQAVLTGAEAANADYASISAEYSRYFFTGFTKEEAAAVDRMEILALLEQQLMAAAQVSAVSVTGNIMTVSISGVTLQELSDLIRDLKAHEIVSDVSVYTAETQAGRTDGGKTAAATMTITLTQPEKDGDMQ